MAGPTAKATEFKEAIKWFRSRVPMLDDGIDAMWDLNRSVGFTVAGVTDLGILNDVWQALDKAIQKGTTFETFKKDVAAKLEEHWGGEKPSRLENIFRTNVQTAYAAGRWEQAQDPEVKEFRPYGRFVALLDRRTTAICTNLNGSVAHLDSPFWKSNWPPLHFSCRSTVISVTEEQATQLGVEVKPTKGAAPLPGFGATPDKRGYEPDTSNIAPELVSASKVR